MAIMDEDVVACYDMSLKDFEHSGVHDLFKVCELLSLLFIYLFLFLCCPFSNVYVCILSNKI